MSKKYCVYSEIKSNPCNTDQGCTKGIGNYPMQHSALVSALD